jgi:2-keto-4-pentenoate hydratase/2-oxohepta-3-ene-1,7-dioic acid hydratase in catechol pathway
VARVVTTDEGIGLLGGDHVLLLDTPYEDIGAALGTGETLASVAARPVRKEVGVEEVHLTAPVLRPSKVWIVGFAYHEHQVETGHVATEGEPAVALVAPSAVTGPFDPVHLPPVAPHRVDYEGELAVVIGRTATSVRERDAWDYIAGFTVCDDVSARDVQKGQLPGWPANPGMAKSFDTFKPLGPAVVSLDEFGDPADLLLRTWVDGELRQQARTSQLIWSIPHVVSYLSSATTLRPGDVISTGTPGGVGHKVGKFLAAGSAVRVEVEGVGAIENRLVALADPTGQRL